MAGAAAAAAGSPVSRHHTGVTTDNSSKRRTLDVLLITAAPFVAAQQAFRLQLAYHGDNLLLRGLHFAKLSWPQRVHIFEQHGGAALRHALQEMAAKFVARALESDCQLAAVRARQHFL